MVPEDLGHHGQPTLRQTVLDVISLGHDLCKAGASAGFSVLARAMRAERPGIVFAHAAASGETDALTHVDTRLFLGLPINTPQ